MKRATNFLEMLEDLNIYWIVVIGQADKFKGEVWEVLEHEL